VLFLATLDNATSGGILSDQIWNQKNIWDREFSGLPFLQFYADCFLFRLSVIDIFKSDTGLSLWIMLAGYA
jgi:hypothetical protein